MSTHFSRNFPKGGRFLPENSDTAPVQGVKVQPFSAVPFTTSFSKLMAGGWGGSGDPVRSHERILLRPGGGGQKVKPGHVDEAAVEHGMTT